MKIFYGALERSIIFIIYILTCLLLNRCIGYMASMIFLSTISFTIGVCFLKNENFYKKCTNLLCIKENYERCIKHMAEITCGCYQDIDQETRFRCGKGLIILSAFFLVNLLYYHYKVKYIFDVESIKLIIICIALLLNSIIGIYLYKRFQNNKQYLFSCLLTLAILTLIYKESIIIFILMILAIFFL